MTSWILFATVLLATSHLSSASPAAEGVTLVTFDGAEGTTFKFVELNDPVMGGKSSGTWTVDGEGHFGVFDGQVVDVPFLKAPGFIKTAADGKFADASSVAEGSLVLVVRTTTPEFKGFRASFASGTMSAVYSCSAGGSLPLSRGCFKAKFSVPVGDNFSTVQIPFSSFSDKWSPATGEQTTTCAEDPDVCPTAKALAGIKRMELWAEGALGKVHLEVSSISAQLGASVQSMASSPSMPPTISSAINLATFDGSTKHTWRAENDPVMGGKSNSKTNVTDGYLDYSGSCQIVPSLKAPGFTIALTESPILSRFPDVSSMDGLLLGVRNAGSGYSGFKIAFCDSRFGFTCQFKSFKADFEASPSTDFKDVFVPWSAFSNKWDAATGKHTAENPPTASTLKSVTQLQVWTEGVEGEFHLQIKYIKASTVSGTGIAMLV